MNTTLLEKLFDIEKLTITSANWLNMIGYDVTLDNNKAVITVNEDNSYE